MLITGGFAAKETFLNRRKLMALSNLLRKLGVIRYGVKAGTYTSSKDIPAEFLTDEVLSAEKDLTTKENLQKAVDALKAGDSGKCCSGED